MPVLEAVINIRWRYMTRPELLAFFLRVAYLMHSKQKGRGAALDSPS